MRPGRLPALVAADGGVASALELLERQVLDAIERRGLALAAPGRLGELVEEEAADYRRRSPVEGLPHLAPEQVRHLRDRLVGLGSLTRLLEDPEVEEVWVNAPDRVFVSRGGRHERVAIELSGREVEEIVERALAGAGRRLDRSLPFVDARLPDGSRLHVVIPPVAEHWTLNIRRFVGLRARTLDELVALRSLSREAARFLAAAVRCGLNVVVAGSVGAGKTTTLACLAAAIPGEERVVVCEEVSELRLEAPDVVALQCRQPNLEGLGEVTLRQLVRESLRMRADRLVVGEARGAECLDMLVAMNCGAGALSSVHANSAREALRKLTTLGLLAGGNIDRPFVARSVAGCVDLVVFCQRRGSRRQVTEILGVDPEPGPDGEPAGGPLFLREDDGELAWTGRLPRAPERFEERGVDLTEVLAG